MKTLNLLLNLGVLSILTMGHQAKAATFGHPDEDVIVGALRNSFQSAETSPTLESIVGKWICQVFSATRGSIEAHTVSLEITHYKNDILFMKYDKDGMTDSMPFFLNEDGLYSSRVGLRLVFGRQKDGNLIFETSRRPFGGAIQAADSISAPEFQAAAYTSCQKASQP